VKIAVFYDSLSLPCRTLLHMNLYKRILDVGQNGGNCGLVLQTVKLLITVYLSVFFKD